MRNCSLLKEERRRRSTRFNECRVRNRKGRKRSTDRYLPSDEEESRKGIASFGVQNDNRDLTHTPQHNFLDFSICEQENNSCGWNSSPHLVKTTHKTQSKTTTRTIEIDTDRVHASQIDDDEIDARDKYIDLEATSRGNKYLPSRSMTLKYRIPRLNQVVKSRKEKRRIEQNVFSFDLILAFFTLRFMSRLQLCLDRDYDESLIPICQIDMDCLKNVMYYIVVWMKHNKLSLAQDENDQLYLHSDDDWKEILSDQKCSHHSDSETSSTESSIFENKKNRDDLSQYIPPEYFQNFLESVADAIDLTPEYIHAHNPAEQHDPETDDDCMSKEIKNLFLIEMEIRKELNEVDKEHAAYQAKNEMQKNIPIDFNYMNTSSATDAFYNAFVAIASSSSRSDETISEGEESDTTFDVENARETVLKLVHKIQNQLPQNDNEMTQESPNVQQKIMNDLLLLSQNPNHLQDISSSLESESSYEILIEIKPSVSSIGCDLDESIIYDDCIDDHLNCDASETTDSIDSITGENVSHHCLKVFNTESFPNLDAPIQIHCEEDYSVLSKPPNKNQQTFRTEDNANIVERRGKTIWTTLLDRRLKSTQKSDRKTPFPPKVLVSNTVSSYLQYKKDRSSTEIDQDIPDQNTSNGDENSLNIECKYALNENIRESQENIEVILNADFEIATTYDVLVPIMNCPSEKYPHFPNERFTFETTSLVPNTKIQHIDQNEKIDNFEEKENISYANEVFTRSKSPKIEFAQKKNGFVLSTESGTSDDSILVATANKSIEHGNTSSDTKVDDTKIKAAVNRENENLIYPRSSDLTEFWESLLTQTFSFEDTGEYESMPLVHSASIGIDSRYIKTNVDAAVSADCESIVKDDPSGQFFVDSYSDANSDPIFGKSCSSVCNIEETSECLEGTYTSSRFDGSDDVGSSEYEEYNPFEAARKIPEVFSDKDTSLEISENRRKDDHKISCELDARNYDEPILTDISDSAETIYFDTTEVKLWIGSDTSRFEGIEVTDSLATRYYTLPRTDCSGE